MSPDKYTPAKIFTVEEANARLPLVRVIVSDLMQLATELSDRRERLSRLSRKRSGGSSDVYQAEVEQVEQELEKESERLADYLRELLELGVEPKSAMAGLVDFPAMIDGKLAYLCWKYDEPEVLYWHSLEGGFAGRQSLTADSATGSDHSDGLLDA
ncbi:MAG: DUF2203 domain-containing protein [Planctomycetaceae bacterium]|nr:DUF2203 domain-containing protein [Planctomycetales bacterium]MCB9874777.1 DUF2203 domain-containing protein [Planctomycetaceae bacterium]MCB9939023.1 DUF2203 domain-containing protein [Planctomycetaceae bacterium]HRX80279.1 DUF2203 domain-containing protein [Pirellulaceae bacterium]